METLIDAIHAGVVWGLLLFMTTTAVTFVVRAITWTRVDGMVPGLADSSVAVVVLGFRGTRQVAGTARAWPYFFLPRPR